MQLCKVRGEVWGAKINPGIEGCKILRLSPYLLKNDKLIISDSEILALDMLHAGAGDDVLISSSSRVRDLTVGKALPLKTITVAVVDGVNLNALG